MDPAWEVPLERQETPAAARSNVIIANKVSTKSSLVNTSNNTKRQHQALRPNWNSLQSFVNQQPNYGETDQSVRMDRHRPNAELTVEIETATAPSRAALPTWSRYRQSAVANPPTSSQSARVAAVSSAPDLPPSCASTSELKPATSKSASNRKSSKHGTTAKPASSKHTTNPNTTTSRPKSKPKANVSNSNPQAPPKRQPTKEVIPKLSFESLELEGEKGVKEISRLKGKAKVVVQSEGDFTWNMPRLEKKGFRYHWLPNESEEDREEFFEELEFLFGIHRGSKTARILIHYNSRYVFLAEEGVFATDTLEIDRIALISRDPYKAEDILCEQGIAGREGPWRAMGQKYDADGPNQEHDWYEYEEDWESPVSYHSDSDDPSFWK
ncbi:hypothetical protein BJ508DRAFT_309606 [Ascobolus immersus RN42]|uniref:Uncharacterized protein n=1 Tax=Ascobolus immersus RN42 TaxID=1160509 RepID=A0A3N4HVV0_ASCIM|nr:hypothetical protein BJ508DRAFT_309606 [Ascobolus immersus RN42]